MNREDAIKVLKQLKRIDDTICESPKNTYAVDMGIEALAQLTSYEQTINKLTKAISEQEPFDIETYCKEHFCVMVDKDVWEKAEKALEQEPKWIPVRERLPEVGSVVLVCYDFKGNRSVYIADFYGDGEFHGYDDEYLTSEGRKYRKAVAWMPLPEPYKAESEDET